VQKMAKAAEWPLLVLACGGLVALFGLILDHPGRPAHVTGAMREIYDARLAAVIVVFAAVLPLTAGAAHRKMAEHRKNREARQAAWRATLLRHADPLAGKLDQLAARVDDHDRRITETAAVARAAGKKVGSLVAFFQDEVAKADRPAAEDLQETELVLRLIEGERKDSA
jgi:hypothetical protein